MRVIRICNLPKYIQECKSAHVPNLGDSANKESNYVGYWDIFDKYSMNFSPDLWPYPGRLSADRLLPAIRLQAGNELEMCKTEVAPQAQSVRS